MFLLQNQTTDYKLGSEYGKIGLKDGMDGGEGGDGLACYFMTNLLFLIHQKQLS